MSARNHKTYYSENLSDLHGLEDQDLLLMGSEENLDLLIDCSSEKCDNLVAQPAPAVCNKVTALADDHARTRKIKCNKVTGPKRGSDVRDKQTLDLIHKSFVVRSEPEDHPLVGNPNTPTSYLYEPDPSYWFSPKPTYVVVSNDNVVFPIWRHSSDRVKLTFANRGLVSLQGFSDSVGAFSLNLTPDVVEAAQGHPDGFVDYLKNNIDRVFKRMVDEIPLYWFGVGADDGRLHLHGAIHCADWSMGVIRDVLVEVGGEMPAGKARHHQLDIRHMHDADGWARYVLDQGAPARRLIKGKSITIPKELRREGQRLYNELREAGR